MKTAIIVNSRGEAFTGWVSRCDISPSGFETYRSEPRFAKRSRLEAGSHPLFDGYPPAACWVDEPKVFGDRRAAERALQRMKRHLFIGDLAVVS